MGMEPIGYEAKPSSLGYQDAPPGWDLSPGLNQTCLASRAALQLPETRF